MALIEQPKDPTLEAIDREVERRAMLETKRGYLGASSIGQPCERRLWYGFRWAFVERFNAETLYRFEDGHRTEDLLAARLRLVPGIQLHTVDPRTGRQFGVSSVAGHFRGHMDGAVIGLLQAPKTWHVWEAKCVGEKGMAKLQRAKAAGEKTALAAWDPVYHAQAQVYMHHTGMERHYLTAATPGGRVMDSVRTDYDPAAAATLEAKAERIVTAATPPTGISEDPAWFECKFCPAAALCHRGEGVQINCRTCVHATPELDGDGRWSCALAGGADIPADVQPKGCPGHRLIPALVKWATVVDADQSQNLIEYETDDGTRFQNGGPAGLSSAEIARGPDVVRASVLPVVAELREQMGATVKRVSWMPQGAGVSA